MDPDIDSNSLNKAEEENGSEVKSSQDSTVVDVQNDVQDGVEDAKGSTPSSSKVVFDNSSEKNGGEPKENSKDPQTRIDNVECASNYHSSLCFADGIRHIDYVLVFKTHEVPEEEEDIKDAEENSLAEIKEHISMREIFESNLIDEGLELEREYKESAGIGFVKIHAPFDVLTRYAELMNFIKPMKELENFDYGKYNSYQTRIKRDVSGMFKGINSIFDVDQGLCPKVHKHYTCVYSRDKDYLFDIPDNQDQFFTTAQRSQVVDYILKRKSFSSDPNEDFDFGIAKLLADNVYNGAYPLHEGEYDDKNKSNPRWILYNQWVSIWKCFKRQPLDLVQEYFGVKVGLYFAWLGFYTSMLLPACIVGLACFIYGILTMDDFVPTKEICNSDRLMCPPCDQHCNYWNLTESCSQARYAYLRYSAKITYRWDLNNYDEFEMPPRPEYIARLAHVYKKQKKDLSQVHYINYVAHDFFRISNLEYKPSFWKQKFPVAVFSTSVVLLAVALAIGAVIGVIMYRMSVLVVVSLQGGSSSMVTSNAKLITSGTAAAINLVCILFFNQVKMPRTQLEFDDSMTLKLFCLQFVNYYASIFYIAFFKGRFTGRPGAYNRMAGFRQEECGSGGCLMELTVQLAVIMIGKQAMNAVIEITVPWIKKFMNTRVLKKSDAAKAAENRWEDDYKLAPLRPQGLFYEYLEMVLQFGFVTIFVSAFPLAPVFALLNNILEIRLDAYKFVTTLRRPVSQRAKSIGIWYRILDSIGKLSVLTNACIIAFTTNVIPRLVYRYEFSENTDLHGYINSSLSYFNTSDFDPDSKFESYSDVEVCSYHDFRKPPESEDKYMPTDLYWHILVARFVFVVVFENAVALIMTLIRWIIPDVPAKLKERIHRENYITQKMILEQELLRAKGFPIPSHSASAMSHVSNYTPNVSDTGGINA
ncbi:Anoctamin-1 [Nymphon striatum]|nr:Anoctamin-1 [Nymphon striatum]